MEHIEEEYLVEGTAIDLFVAYRFLRILTTPWEDQPAYKLGIIDKDGKLLKEVGTSARLELENLYNKKVNLKTWVKVKSKWSDSTSALKQFGY